MLVEYLMRQIRADEWQADHPQPITFSSDRMIDGQHRLMAISAAGVTVEAHVRTGVRDDLRQYIDTGISRALEDRCCFSEDGEINRRVGQLITSGWFLTNCRSRPTPLEAKEIFDTNSEGLLFAATWLHRHKIRGVMRAPVMVALAEFYRLAKDWAEAFVESLVKPDGEVQQARILRDYLLRNADTSGHADAQDKYTKAVSAMISFAHGKEIKVLRGSNWKAL
mgnify:CR=1 FL=1